MTSLTTDPADCVLRPSAEEIRDTHVLFHTRHATDLTPERAKIYGYTVTYHATIVENLRRLGLKVTTGSDPQMLFGALDFDYVYFTQVEAAFSGHETLIPAIAAYRGVPFLGPPAPMRSLSEDKVLGKAMAAALGVGVARHRVIDPLAPGVADQAPPGRWILKPRTGVMSEQLSLIESPADWRAAIARAADPHNLGREFLAEEFVPGLNLAVPVVEGFPPMALPVFVEHGEARNNILTETGKEGQSRDYAAEPYAGPGAVEAAAAAARLAAAIAPFDYARFDFRFEPVSNRLVFLEVNLNCAMGPAAVVTRAANLRGVDHESLVGHIFTHSLRRQRRGA